MKTEEIHSSYTVEHGPNRRELAAKYPVKKYGTRQEYVEALGRAKYALSPKGAGWDCQRHYEILGRCVPLIEVGPDAPLHFQEMWRDGENCLTFDGSSAMIEDKIERLSPMEWNKIVECGFNEILDKYKASKVANNVLVKLGV